MPASDIYANIVPVAQQLLSAVWRVNIAGMSLVALYQNYCYNVASDKEVGCIWKASGATVR